MKVFSLTKLGRKVYSRGDGSSSDEEMKIIQYIGDGKTATDSELETVGGRWLVEKLKRDGLVKELTNES